VAVPTSLRRVRVLRRSHRRADLIYGTREKVPRRVLTPERSACAPFPGFDFDVAILSSGALLRESQRSKTIGGEPHSHVSSLGNPSSASISPRTFMFITLCSDTPTSFMAAFSVICSGSCGIDPIIDMMSSGPVSLRGCRSSGGHRSPAEQSTARVAQDATRLFCVSAM
jgi:hypothetical protein